MSDHGALAMSTQIIGKRRRGIGWLTALAVARATRPGMYADGGGLTCRSPMRALDPGSFATDRTDERRHATWDLAHSSP
jgi:hypothetical protein